MAKWSLALATWTRAVGWAEGDLLKRDGARTGEEEVVT